MEGGRAGWGPLLRAVFHSENSVFKELASFISQDGSHQSVLSMEAVAALKEKLLSTPTAASQVLGLLEAAGTCLPSTSGEDKHTADGHGQKPPEATPPARWVGQVCRVFLDCLEHCLWRLDNLNEKLQQEEGEYSALLKRQQRGYSPMRSNMGLAKQKTIASAEASKFKERIMATNMKKGEIESLFYKLLSLSSCLDAASMSRLFPKMITLSYEKKLLAVNKLYICMLSASTECLQAYCEREADYLVRKFYDKNNDLTHGLVPLSSPQVREIFHVCVHSTKHIMEIFFDHLSTSLSSMKEMETKDFLWLAPLWPLLYIQTVTSSQGVVEHMGGGVLWKKHSTVDPLLAEVCGLLQRDVKLVQWCLTHNSRLKIQPLLQLVRDHSPLCVIHKSLQLNTLVPSDVLVMLQEHCMARDSTGLLHSSCKNTFTAFCILSQMFEVIGAGMQLDNISTGWQARRRSHTCKLSASNGTNSFQERQSHSSFYKHNIAEKLKSVKKSLETLQPLAYRLELMEDIYSLMFVRHSDMSDEDHSEASADEGEMELSLLSQHTDADSLRSLTVSSNLPHQLARDSPDPTSVSESNHNAEAAAKKKVIDFSEYVVLDEKGIERLNFSSKQSSISSVSASHPISKSPSPEGKEGEDSASNDQVQWEGHQHPSQSGGASPQRQSSYMNGKTSSSSARELPRTGYLINTLVAWDVMLMLKDVLFLYTNENFKQMRSDETVPHKGLESRVSYLSMCVNEGLWRLQVMVPGSHSFASHDIFDEYLDGTLFSRDSHHLVYEVSPPSVNTKKKLGKDAEPAQMRGCSTERSSIINYLFAPSSSLITLSLANGNVERIEKIFHTFQLPDTTDKREAHLAMRLSQLRPKLSVSPQRSGRSREPKAARDFGTSEDLLQSIGLLAREGMAHVGATNLIHDLITSLPPPVPKGIPEAAMTTECPVITSFMTPMALVLTDLALTVDVTETTATYIMEQVFQRHSGTHPEHRHVETCGGITGYYPLLQQLGDACRALTKLKDEPNPEGDSAMGASRRDVHKKASICLTGQTATPFSLLMSSLPLRDVELTAYLSGWAKVLKNVSAVQEALFDKNIKLEDDTTVKHPLYSQKNPVHVAYKTLLLTLSTEASHLWCNSARDKACFKVGAYVRSFYQYLQLLSAMVTQHAEEHFLSRMNSHFSLLDDRPVEILGTLIFEEAVDPARLEPIANKMRLSLTAMILQYCFPNFPITGESFNITHLPSRTKGKVHPLGFLVERERVVMNAGTKGCQEGVHGELVVQGLLTSLLSSLHEATQPSSVISQTGLRASVLNDTTAPRFLALSDVLMVLRDTADLTAVDFNKMPPGREAVVFFVNLANLMFIHAGLLNHILYPASKVKVKPEARGVFSNHQLERICALKRLGYMVGQLGFLSLYDILYTVLRLQNPLSSILVQNDPINRISICESNLICTKLLHKREELSSISELLDPLSSRISFCVTQGTPVSPRVQVLFVDRMEEQLEEGVQEHMRLFFIAQSKRKRKQSLETQDNSKKGLDKCKVVTSRTVLDYLAAHPTGIVGGMQKLQKSMPLEMAAMVQEFISELSKGKPLEIDVLDREEKRGIVLEIFESFEEENYSNLIQDEAQTTSWTKEPCEVLWKEHGIPKRVSNYLYYQCPLLSFLVQIFHRTADHTEQKGRIDPMEYMAYLQPWIMMLYPPSVKSKPSSAEIEDYWPVVNLFTSTRNLALARVHGNNKVASALSCGPEISAIWDLADSLLGSGAITRDHQKLLQEHATTLVDVLEALPPSTRENHPDLTLFLDQLLVFLVQNVATDGDPGPWSFACRIADTETRYAVVMEAHRSWPAEPAQEMLKIVGHDPLLSVRLQEMADIRTRKLSLYEKILKLEGLSCKLWQEVEQMSIQEPTRLMQHLVQKKKFSLSMEWAKYHNGSAELHRLVDQSHLMEVLDKTSPDFSVASEAMEALTHLDLSVIVQELLHKLSNFSTRQFLIEFYLRKHFCKCAAMKSVQTFRGEGSESPESNEDAVAAACEPGSAGGGGGGGGSSPVDVGALLQEVMGLLLIEAVAPPGLDRFQLSPLVTSPHLIVEQWLMNVRLEAVEKAVEVLHPFLDMMDTHMVMTGKPRDLDSPRNAKNERVPQGLSWTTLNQLLETYAAKALDTSGVQLALKPSATIEKAPKKFVMPAHPPEIQDWVPDAEVRKCPVCEVTIFSMFSRRHHCRRCGRVVCSTCSQHRSLVQGYGGLSVRVCLDCYNQTKELNLNNYIQIRPLGDGTYDSVSVSVDEQSPHRGASLASDMEGGWYLSKDEQHNDIIRNEFCFDYAPSLSLCLAILSHHQDDRKAALCVIKLCHHLFSLITSSLQLMNPTVDHTFVLSMIQTLLASAKVRFGNTGEHRGIGLCEYYTQWVDLLSLILKSNCGHIIPHEALENMQMIGELHQKSLVREGDTQMVLDRRLKQEFLYMRRLRDMLVKRQMWGLALDVSTKVGLEANGVWGAWAMASLKAGDFLGARERFSRILERPSDKNKPCKPSLLSEVIKYLESNPFQVNQQVMEQAQRTRSSIMLTDHNKLSSSQALVVLHSLQSLHKIAEGSLTCKDSYQRASLRSNKQRKASTPKMESIFQAECKYYLTLYGNHAMTIQYFMRHRQTQECVEYIQHTNVDLEVFIQNALLSILRRGQLSPLMASIHAADPHMEKWGKLLLGSCRWLERSGWWNCLLSLQEAMGDRLRASMTLLRMYTDGATSYMTLSSRSEHVILALTHLQAYLDQQALIASSPKRKISILTMSPWQINQNINMLKLQTDVTKFLAGCEASGTDIPACIKILADLKIVKDNSLPTLLTSDGGRLGVAILVMCLADVAADGLALAYRIVEHTQMSVERLLSKCCLVLVERGHLKHIGRVVRSVKEWEILTAATMDAALRPAMLSLASTTNAAHLDTLVKLLSSDTARMDMFLECRRLRSAYLVAVHVGERLWVERVKAAALIVGQNHVASMCDKWLSCKDSGP
ncbi:uncharacterized protein LOC135109948 [Scylla paramamosain]|uniref:uncharacterized protein LOC135109948 n=1 Tax=Scylla paramamosain TaxID=85552 RepID=UPI003083BA2A